MCSCFRTPALSSLPISILIQPFISDGIDLSHAFENLMLALCKCQEWKEQVKVSWYRKFGDFILITVVLVKFLKTENLTENVWKFCIEWALMPTQPRSHAHSHTFSIKIMRLFFGFTTSSMWQFLMLGPYVFSTNQLCFAISISGIYKLLTLWFKLN